MYENVGKKIKGVATFFCWAGIIASFVYAGILFYNAIQVSHYYSFSASNKQFLTIILILICGVAISWLASLTLYGFGELVDRTSSIDDKLDILDDLDTVNKADNKRAQRADDVKMTIICNECGFEQDYANNFCCKCGKKLK